MNRSIILALFVAVAVFQLAIPGSIILRQQQVLATGEDFKFQMRLFDPGDPFRGNYLQLAFEQETAPRTTRFYFPGTSCVAVAVGEDGFAKVTAVTENKPESGAFFKATRTNFQFNFPFSRFFINEYQARKAEALIRDALRDQNTHDTYALVRIGRGHAVLVDLYVHGQPLRQALEQ